MNEGKPQTRDPGIDLVKAAAILGVIVLHTSSYGLYGPLLRLNWVAALVWGSVFRASVPLFFMCSGALLLDPDRELSLRRLYGRNILHIALALLAWAMFYKVFHLLLNGGFSGAALWQSCKEVLLFDHEFHLYFLHIILLVYALLPLTRRFVKGASETELRYALALWFLLGIVFPTLRPFRPFRLLSAFPLQWMLNMSYAAAGYGLLGWYLMRHPLPAKLGGACAALGATLTFALTMLFSAKGGALEEHFLDGMTVNVCLLAAGLFLLLTRLGKRLRGGAKRAVTILSGSSFCVYLVHVVWLNVFQNRGWTASLLPASWAVPVLTLAVWALSLLCWLPLSRVPWVKKWLI